jgi:hypothetical protein
MLLAGVVAKWVKVSKYSELYDIRALTSPHG